MKIELAPAPTGEPAEVKEIVCDAAAYVEGVAFPTAKPRVMLPKRTFWEKATAVHVISQQTFKDEHMSRHWHDLVRDWNDFGHATEALSDRQLAKDVAEFKAKFFARTYRAGNPIDYAAAVSGSGRLCRPIPRRSRRWRRIIRRWRSTAFCSTMPKTLTRISPVQGLREASQRASRLGRRHAGYSTQPPRQHCFARERAREPSVVARSSRGSKNRPFWLTRCR